MNTIKESNKLAKEMCSTNYRYLYGGKGQKYTKALVEKLAKAYPKVYTPSILKEALKDADKGYIAIDCSGYVCKVLGISNKSSTALHNECYKEYAVSEKNAKEGMAIWKSGHIAYIGEGKKIYEAASTKSDMKVSDFSKRAKDFTKLIVVKGSALEKEMKAPKQNLDQVVKDVINGKYGNGNKRKIALEKAGYNYAEVQALVNKKLSGK